MFLGLRVATLGQGVVPKEVHLGQDVVEESELIT